MDRKTYIEYLVNTYADDILHFSYNYLKNYEDAKDVCQTVFIKFISKCYSFENQKHEKAFLYKVTVNVCKDFLRNPWRKRICGLEHCEELIAPEPTENGVMWAVNQLEVKYRVIIYLYYYEGYNAEEIGKIMKIIPATVHTRLARGRKKLKQILEESGYEEL